MSTMKITCLVDDEVRPHSDLRKEHGLCMLIESPAGNVLWDTGGSGEVLLHNMRVAGVDLQSIQAVAISHAHYDHTGGLPALLALRPGLPVYANADLLRERFAQREGEMKNVGLPLDEESLRRQADLRLSAHSQEILPGIWTSGEIFPRMEAEGRSSSHFARSGKGLLPDGYRDDMALVLQGTHGLVLVCGCSHAGLLNTIRHVQQGWGQDPIAVVGGTHLIAADEAHMRRLIEVLQQTGAPELYLNHCTGQNAYLDLALAFGERVAPFPAGAVLNI